MLITDYWIACIGLGFLAGTAFAGLGVVSMLGKVVEIQLETKAVMVEIKEAIEHIANDEMR